jgi:hypothetical protein
MKWRSTEEFKRSLNRAEVPVEVWTALREKFVDLLRNGQSAEGDTLRSRILGDWWLYFRYPRPNEPWHPSIYILLSVSYVPESRTGN